ncbi:MAG TPA: iron export ABC transporter permease subunit FetB [Firmicutes bacterium]|nr:iron export ABC transporter permease subunit FetB [Bacillota bacterium]
MSTWSLLAALSLVAVGVAVSRAQSLGLEKDILWGAFRAALQLTVIGFVLRYVFGANHWLLTTAMVSLMILVAGQTAAQRGKAIPHAFWLAIAGIAAGSAVTLALMVGLRIISYRPDQVIPISGMIVGNAMVASALVLNRLKDDADAHRAEITAALALGATAGQAIEPVLRRAIRTGMIPSIDSMKTVGLVQLPGMMTGLILAGASPVQAVRYQILVAFMLTCTVAVTCTTVGYLAYRRLFTPAHQLLADQP